MCQSVLDNLQWADVSGSPFLTALKVAAGNGLLSIKFNVDTFNMDATSPEFMTGRIVGTIGPAALSEPRHLVVGRQFMAADMDGRGHGHLVADMDTHFLMLGTQLPTANNIADLMNPRVSLELTAW